MVVIVLATLLIVAVTYYQVIQGLFSALIMALLTVVCAVFALNTYDALATAFLHARQGPYAEAVALAALFVLPLLTVRIAMDLIVAHNIAFSPWIDRVVGGVLGLITGMVMAGMLLIVMQLLPFGESILGFQPFDDGLQRNQRVVPFYPDEFTVGLGRFFSRGAFSTDASFDEVHTDLLLESHCVRNTAGRNGGIWALPDTASVTMACEPNEAELQRLGTVPDYVDRPEGPPPVQTKVVVLRVSINRDACDRDEWMRLAGTQFRLVTRPKQSKGEDEYYEGPVDPASYYPVGYLFTDRAGKEWRLATAEEKDNTLQVGKLCIERKLAGKSPSTSLYWVYRLTVREEPDYLVFRRVCRTPAPKTVEGLPPLQ